MSRDRDLSGLLRWYPRGWRERYGEELVVLIEDTLGDERPSPSLRWTIARSGLSERARAGGWAGNTASPNARVSAGAFIILGAWTALVIAGAAFAKVSEHFDTALPNSSGNAAEIAWRTTEIAAIAAALAVLTGAVIALPALIRAWRDGRCGGLRAHLVTAVTATSVAVGATAGIVAWAHTLAAPERETAPWPYALGFTTWGALVALCLVSWTALAIASARRVTFTRTELRAEAGVAVVVAAAMAAITVAAIWWWRAMAIAAPWFLHGAPPGASRSGLDIRVLVIVTAMAGAVGAAMYGVSRIARSLPEITAD